MVLITEFEQDKKERNVKPVFHSANLSAIINYKKCRGLNFLVLSIVGAKRTGKSFLANLMVCYLKFLEKVWLHYSGLIWHKWKFNDGIARHNNTVH